MKKQRSKASLIPSIAVLCGSFLVPAEAGAQAVPACGTPTTAFCSSQIPLPADWKGRVFQLSQNYPTNAPQDEQPWLTFDPTTQPQKYIEAVLKYFFDGNIRSDVEASFDPSLNAKRKWFHAPWQDSPLNINSREPVHGLTRERVSRPLELAPQQTSQWNNYAVGFYNAPGGVVIGRVWADHGHPDASKGGSLPEGTVAAKLLFTTATVAEVPYLQGSPEWNAYVYANPNDPAPKVNSPRAIQKVRLLQIDIAVKDSRVAATTGWVFGTYVYGGGPGGPKGQGWTNVAPVGVMWGNDPGYAGSGPLRETWLNPAVHMPHVGYQGRLNGPVDNKISSCLSCHATAQIPAGQMIPPAGTDPSRWFQNLRSGTSFDTGTMPLDYSLQITVGLREFANANQVKNAKSPAEKVDLTKKFQTLSLDPTRAGETK